jgi:hypothetical protein
MIRIVVEEVSEWCQKSVGISVIMMLKTVMKWCTNFFTTVLQKCHKCDLRGVPPLEHAFDKHQIRLPPDLTSVIMLEWCYSGVTVVLRWCCNGVTMVLQWCCHGVALQMVLQWCYNDVTMVVQWCYNGVTMVSQWCYNGVTMVLQWCYNGVTMVLQWCYNGVTMVLQTVPPAPSPSPREPAGEGPPGA